MREENVIALGEYKALSKQKKKSVLKGWKISLTASEIRKNSGSVYWEK